MSNKQKIAVRVFLGIFGFIFVVQFFKLVGKGFDSLLEERGHHRRTLE